MSITTTQLRTRRFSAVLVGSQVLLAVPMGAGGVQKLIGTSAMVDLFSDIGIGQWLRLLVGILEVAGAVGLLIPRVWGLAALGLAGVLTGAAFTNVVILQESPIVPMVLLVLAAFIAWARRDSIRSLARPRPADTVQHASSP